jgi:hypothetical protein
MSTPLPYWIQLLQALCTLAIAALAAVIAIAQWRIAKQKAVVDIFDKRMDVYNSLRAVVQKVMSAGNATRDVAAERARDRDSGSIGRGRTNRSGAKAAEGAQ